MSNPYGNDPYGQQPQNPYGGAGGAGGAYPPPPPGGGFEEPKTDGVSVASFILSLLCCTGLIGLILGFVGLSRTKGGQRKGRGFAIAGIVLGIVSLLVGAAAVLFLVVFANVTVSLDEAKVGQCVNTDDDKDPVVLYKKDCTEDHDGEIVAVAKVDDSNRDEISSTMADYCAQIVSDEDAAKLGAIDGLSYKAVIEDPDKVENGDHLVCYVTSDTKLDKPIL